MSQPLFIGNYNAKRANNDLRPLFMHESGIVAPVSITLGSLDFRDNEPMPASAKKQLPALVWSGLPEGAAELALVIEDVESTNIAHVHLLATGIPATWAGMKHDSLEWLRLGLNTFGTRGYRGPALGWKEGPHRYMFQLFALGEKLNFGGLLITRARLLRAMQGLVLSCGQLAGVFQIADKFSRKIDQPMFGSWSI